MVQSGRDGEESFHLPRGETYVPPGGLAARFRALPRGPTLVGLAVAAALAGAALLVAGRRLAGPGGERLAALVSRDPTHRREVRRARHEAKVQGFWAGVLASAGSAVASVVARRLAEDVLQTARRERVGERPAEE